MNDIGIGILNMVIKTVLKMMVVFSVKIVKELYFLRNLEIKIFNTCVARQRRKKVSECVATSNQFESECSIQIIIAESAKVLIQPEFF